MLASGVILFRRSPSCAAARGSLACGELAAAESFVDLEELQVVLDHNQQVYFLGVRQTLLALLFQMQLKNIVVILGDRQET